MDNYCHFVGERRSWKKTRTITRSEVGNKEIARFSLWLAGKIDTLNGITSAR